MDKDYRICSELIDKGYRGFRAQRADYGTWYTLEARRLAVGDYCDVYVEKDSDVTLAQAIAVAYEYDNNIYEKITTNFGNYEDVDNNEKITLLLLHIVDGYRSDGDSYVAGYFDPTHMVDLTVAPNSNECDMIFIDIDPVEIESEEFYTTIAHEFQHMINYSQTYMATGEEQDLWINEGLSSGAEYVYSGEVSDERVWWFNNDPLDTIVMGNNFFVWNGYWEYAEPNAVLDNYATVNLFFQWLRIHASNDTAIYKEILNSTNRDYRAVTAAAGARINSQFSAWDRLLETWYLANYRCQDTGYYGYKGALTTAAIGWDQQSSYEYELEAGEGIISAASANTGDPAAYTPPSGSGDNIQYAGFDYADTDVDRVSSFYNEFILVMNANTDNTAGQFEDCFVANVVGGQGNNPVMQSIQARKAANIKAAPKGYNIGFHPGLNDSRETPEQKMLKGQGGKITPVKKSAARKGR